MRPRFNAAEVRWTYFYLYVILDVFSRYVAGWMVAPREGAELAKQFIEGSFATERISPAATGGFQKRDRVRFVIYSSFDNHPGKRRILASQPFQWTRVTQGRAQRQETDARSSGEIS